MKLAFYRCEICGQIVAIVHETGESIFCGCTFPAEPMKKLIPHTVDLGKEKHIPVCKVSGNQVEITVGSVPHPMTDEHFIQWIAIQTFNGNQRKELLPGDEPKAYFSLNEGDKVLAVYAYCNLHGLWKNRIIDESSEK